jgi:hypothetical protein
VVKTKNYLLLITIVVQAPIGEVDSFKVCSFICNHVYQSCFARYSGLNLYKSINDYKAQSNCNQDPTLTNVCSQITFIFFSPFRPRFFTPPDFHLERKAEK